MATKKLAFDGELTKRSIKSKNNWKPRYFQLWHVEGGPPVLEYYAKKGDSKPKGELVLGPGSCAQLKSDLCKKAHFGMHVKVIEVAAAHTKGGATKKMFKKKSKSGETTDLYAYAETFGAVSRWVQEIQDCVALAHGDTAGGGTPARRPRGNEVPETIKEVTSPRSGVKSVKSGILYKKSKKKWTPKLFVLEGTSLQYFDSEDDYRRTKYNPKRRIPLRKGTHVCNVERMPADKKTPGATVGFSLTELPKIDDPKYHPKYNLCADTEADCKGWMQAIRQALESATQGPNASKPKTQQELADQLANAGSEFPNKPANPNGKDVQLDKVAPNDPSRATELKEEMERRGAGSELTDQIEQVTNDLKKARLRREQAINAKDFASGKLHSAEELKLEKVLGTASAKLGGIRRTSIKALLLSDFQEMLSTTTEALDSRQSALDTVSQKLAKAQANGDEGEVERLSKVQSRKQSKVQHQRATVDAVQTRCVEVAKELQQDEDRANGHYPMAPGGRKRSTIGMSPVYNFMVSFVDDTKLGLKLSKKILKDGSAVIMVIGFNVDRNGNPLQPAATSQIHKGDILFAVEGRTSFEDQLKGIKSSKRPLQVTFQRNAQVLDASDDNNTGPIADERVLGAIPKWEEYAKAEPEYWHSSNAADSTASSLQSIDRKASTLSVAEVGQLLTAWNLYKAFGKEFLSGEVNGDTLMDITESDLDRADYPRAQGMHFKLLFRKLKEVKNSSEQTVTLHRPNVTRPPPPDASNLTALFTLMETGGTDPDAPSRANYSI